MRIAHKRLGFTSKPLFAARLTRSSIVLAAFAFLAGGALVFGTQWRPNAESYPVQGVNVSHNQGTISWPLAAADHVDFAYIKATEGADLKDPRFAENWKGASQAGIRYGAYHYFTLCRLANDQATNFIATVPRDEAALPAAIYLDFDGNCAERPSRSVLLQELKTFIEMVEAHTGKSIILYTTQDFDDFYQVSNAVDRPLWLRRMAFPPDFGARPWAMWQASGMRWVSGITGPVDWNVVRK